MVLLTIIINHYDCVTIITTIIIINMMIIMLLLFKFDGINHNWCRISQPKSVGISPGEDAWVPRDPGDVTRWRGMRHGGFLGTWQVMGKPSGELKWLRYIDMIELT